MTSRDALDVALDVLPGWKDSAAEWRAAMLDAILAALPEGWRILDLSDRESMREAVRETMLRERDRRRRRTTSREAG